MEDKYTSRGMGFEEIAEDAGEMLLAEAVRDRASGEIVIDRDAIDRILADVDDIAHFSEPLAQALFRLVMDKGARIVWSAKGEP